MNIGIVITGIICDYYLDDLIKQYNGCTYTKIISTWNYIDKNIIDKLRENNFHIVQSDFPENIYPKSVNFQNKSAEKGIEYAETIDITHILRVRADMSCNNVQRLLEIYESIYEENKMIFLLHFHNVEPGYLLDYAHFGDIDWSKKYICNYQSEHDNRFPEQFRQECCFGTSELEIIKKHVIYSGQKLFDENIDFCFTKHGYLDKNNLIKFYIQDNLSKGYYSF